MQEIYKTILQADPTQSVEDVLRGTTVLFADEDQDTLEEIKTVVTALNWKGHYIHDAVELMDKVNEIIAEKGPIDAIVAEIHYLSGSTLTGITAAREIRKAMPNVPIVFLSSYVTTSMIREEIRRVSAEYLTKPLDVTQLFVRLSKLIYWYRLTESHFYMGPERRNQSINRTSNQRRACDYKLSTPTRIAETLELGEQGK